MLQRIKIYYCLFSMVFSAIKPRNVFFLKKIVFNRFLTFVGHLHIALSTFKH